MLPRLSSNVAAVEPSTTRLPLEFGKEVDKNPPSSNLTACLPVGFHLMVAYDPPYPQDFQPPRRAATEPPETFLLLSWILISLIRRQYHLNAFRNPQFAK